MNKKLLHLINQKTEYSCDSISVFSRRTISLHQSYIRKPHNELAVCDESAQSYGYWSKGRKAETEGMVNGRTQGLHVSATIIWPGKRGPILATTAPALHPLSDNTEWCKVAAVIHWGNCQGLSVAVCLPWKSKKGAKHQFPALAGIRT